MQSGLERGFRYFKVSPIKAFRDIRQSLSIEFFATCRYAYLLKSLNSCLWWDMTHKKKEESMDKECIKKILAGLSIAGLMTGGVLTTPERAYSA